MEQPTPGRVANTFLSTTACLLPLSRDLCKLTRLKKKKRVPATVSHCCEKDEVNKQRAVVYRVDYTSD